MISISNNGDFFKREKDTACKTVTTVKFQSPITEISLREYICLQGEASTYELAISISNNGDFFKRGDGTTKHYYREVLIG